MTMMTISDQDPRSLKAVEIAAGASSWLKCRSRDGQKAYGVPSQCQAGRYYLTTCQRCDCQDAQRHPGQACKHQLAVRLHVALVKGARSLPRPRSPLQVRQHPDGEITWERRDGSDGETMYMPRRSSSAG
jgi:hypothetical protein